MQNQGWRIRDFEGAQAPPERTSAPPHRQKHPLKIKEKLCKIPSDTKIQHKYGYLRLNLGKKLKRTTIILRYALNLTITSRKAHPDVSTILHPCAKLSYL